MPLAKIICPRRLKTPASTTRLSRGWNKKLKISWRALKRLIKPAQNGDTIEWLVFSTCSRVRSLQRFDFVSPTVCCHSRQRTKRVIITSGLVVATAHAYACVSLARREIALTTVTLFQATLPSLLAVALGGSLGAVLRYLISLWTMARFDVGFWLGTLLVNAIGALLIGVLFVLISEKAVVAAHWRPLLVVGLLGSLTTFSTFSLELVTMLQQGAIGPAIAYILASVLICVTLTWAGIELARLF